MGVFDTATKKITDLLGVTAKGQGTMANSLPVVVASNQTAVPVAGDVAHDAADSGNPLKIGGKASTSEPAAVANGDRVNGYWDEHGRLGVHTSGEILEVAGDVNSVSQGDAPHDAADTGNPVKVGGKAVSSAPSDVANNDRVNAQYDLKGRLAVFAGHGGTMVIAGDVNSVSQGDTPHDAADSGSPLKVGGKASTSEPAAVANGDRVNAQFDTVGRMAVFPGHGQSMPISAEVLGEKDDDAYDPETSGFTEATIISTLRYLANRREPITELHQYNSSVILVPTNGIEALISTATDDITAADPLTNPSSLAHGSWTSSPQYIWIPYDAAQRYVLFINNNFNVSINVMVSGMLYGEVLATPTQPIAQALQQTATTIANGTQAVWSAYAGIGTIAALQTIPILDAPWNWLQLVITPAGDPTSGGLQLTFQVRKE